MTKTTSQKKLEAEQAKLAGLREKLEVANVDLECSRLLPAATTQQAAALLDGPTGGVDVEIFDRDKLEEERGILVEAIRLQGRRVEDLNRTVGAEVYAKREVEHDSLVEKIVELHEELHDAMRAEFAFTEEIRRAGTTAKRLRLTETPWLKNIRNQSRTVLRTGQIGRGFNIRKGR